MIDTLVLIIAEVYYINFYLISWSRSIPATVSERLFVTLIYTGVMMIPLIKGYRWFKNTDGQTKSRPDGGNTPMIRCRKCECIFSPEMKKRTWACPACQTKNPNLKRHYRYLADLCILGFIISTSMITINFGKIQNFITAQSAAHSLLFLIAIVLIYKSKAPWIDSVAKTLRWTVFGFVLYLSVVFLLASPEILTHVIIVVSLMLLYLFWLNSQTIKCTVPEESEN